MIEKVTLQMTVDGKFQVEQAALGAVMNPEVAAAAQPPPSVRTRRR